MKHMQVHSVPSFVPPVLVLKQLITTHVNMRLSALTPYARLVKGMMSPVC